MTVPLPLPLPSAGVGEKFRETAVQPFAEPLHRGKRKLGTPQLAVFNGRPADTAVLSQLLHGKLPLRSQLLNSPKGIIHGYPSRPVDADSAQA